MPGKRWMIGVMVIAMTLPLIAWTMTGDEQDQIVRRFDDAPTGRTPKGWKVEGTNQEGPTATWTVMADPEAPSRSNVLALSRTNHDSGRTFNLCWTDQLEFQSGSIELKFKANSGEIDRGGGPVWRVIDKDNYYICRANPLESNFRLYYVKDGKRKQIASANVEIPSGTWQTIRIEHDGDRIECSLNGTKLLTVQDDTFPEAGGIGFWTKADAVTSFDDLVIKPK